MRKKIFIHQQDIQIGLANKIMSKFADCITVSFKEQLKKFNNKNIFFTGNPCRFTDDEINRLNKEELLKKYNLKNAIKIATKHINTKYDNRQHKWLNLSKGC
jgi:UDP-N-acetylglucosamine--N-acetylmuramyl-(pentapeptide) pyrophosphoryl-undecaprenol N-acetylglucosamine transferase